MRRRQIFALKSQAVINQKEPDLIIAVDNQVVEKPTRKKSRKTK